MNCEMAETNLSAYLDDMLDPQLRDEVAAHLESCAQCSEVVGEYRRYDQVLKNTPRLSPSAAVRDRIFSSPEFAAILRQRERATGTAAPAYSTPNTSRTPPRRTTPHWTRIALQSAAVLLILIGSALLLRQGFFHSGASTANHNSTPVIGNPNPNGLPLAAGNRVVYAHDGALWSAPENGPGLAHQLTSTDITVGTLWSISPDGRLVAYVEASNGRIHVVRSDGQSDISFSASYANCAGTQTCVAPTSLAWSPDGKYLAYQALDGSLHLVNADGTNDQVLTSLLQGTATALLWNGSSHELAFIEVQGNTQSLWSYSLADQHVSQIAAQADPNDVLANVQTMYWLPDTQHPALTWAAWDASTKTLTGLFTHNLQANTTQQLTPTNAHLTAAAFTPRQHDGLWLVATDQNDTQTLATVQATQPGLSVTNAAPGDVITGISWSPAGSILALVSASGQMTLATQNGATLLSNDTLDNVTGTPIWSPDGTHLTTATSGGIFDLNIGATIGIVRLFASVADVTHSTMLWSTDSQVIAIATSSGVYLTKVDNITDSKIARQVDTQATVSGLSWSVAG